VKRSSAFGFDEGGVHRNDSADAMDLVVRDFKKRQTGEGAHLFRVADDAVLNRIAGGGFLVARLASGKDDGCGHPFKIPFEGTANGFVKVVDIEDEASVGCGEGAEIAHVGVATDLGFDAGVRNDCEVCGHNGSRSAEEDEGRLRHQLVLELEEGRNAAALGAIEECKRKRFAGLDVELVILLTTELLAARVAEVASLFGCCPGHRSSPHGSIDVPDGVRCHELP